MTDNTVKRVVAGAYLADCDRALERARRTFVNDPDWPGFEAQVTFGALLPVRLRVSVEAAASDGEDFTLERQNEDVWVGAPTHLPELAEEIREAASKDFGVLSSELRERGIDVSGNDLGEMYVEVALDEALREAAARFQRSAPTPGPDSLTALG